MSEKLSLTSPSQPASPKARSRYLQTLFGIVGLLVVLYGAHDFVFRLESASLDPATLLANAALPSSPHALGTTTPALRLSAPAITPARLVIPSIGVNALVEEVGKNASGAMATPTKFADVAWYGLGAEPGSSGNAVFAGHVNNALMKAGVFLHLADVQVGDRVLVEDSGGHVLTFAVQKIEDYPENSAPVETIFSDNGASGIVLITCAGDWDPKVHSFNERLVVYASLTAE